MGLFDLFKKKSPEKIINKDELKIDIEFEDVENDEKNEDIISLESRIRKAIPSPRGLYPHEILMLDYASTFTTGENSFQNFWKWNYSVFNPQSILDSLFEKEFICEGNIRGVLTKRKVTELKDLLKSKGEKTSGKKEELIDRILNVYDSLELERLFPERYYMLTEKGTMELEENEYVSYLHRHDYMTVWDMNIILNVDNQSKLGYRDIIWRELNKDSLEYFKNMDFGLYRNIRLKMYRFLVEEEKFKTAFRMLCEVIAFDLSGLGNGEANIINDRLSKDLVYRSRMVNLFFNDNEKEVTLPPGIIQYFDVSYRNLGMTSEEFIKYTYEQFDDIYIHERIFNEKECANIILSEIGLEERSIINSYEIADIRVRDMVGL